MCLPLKLIFFSKDYSRYVSITLTSSGSHTVGPSKNSSRLISRTNVRMHTNVDISEIKQIEAAKVMMGTMDPVTRTRAVMEVEGRMAAVAAWRKMMTTRAITKVTVPVPATRMISTSLMIFTSERYT